MDLNLKDQNYNQLVSCLDQLVKVYRALLEVVRREKDILVESNVEGLSENNRAKEAMIIKIKSLETQRMRCAKDLAHLIGADVERPRLSEIASRFDGPQGEKLRNAQSVLELLIKRVSEINKENEVLVQAALSSINGAMQSIKDTLQDKNTYQSQGKIQPSQAPGHLVRKEL